MSWWKSMQFTPELAAQVRNAIGTTRVVRPDTLKIGSAQIALAVDIPWVFIKPGHQPYCDIWNHTYWQEMGLLPEWCRTRCHKVVVKPRNILELFNLWEVMDGLNVPGKLGVDRREYTFGPYAAFFYTTSMKEGLMRYKQVRAVVSEHLSPDVSVILKKACTEMEHKRYKGKRSDEWGDPTEDDKVREMMLNDMFERREDQLHQPDWLKNLISFTWLATAHAIGDAAYYPLIEKLGIEDNFGDPPVTYHHLTESVELAESVEGKEVGTTEIRSVV